MAWLRRIARSRITWALAGVAAVVVAAGAIYLEPWRLFTSTTVEEAAPVPAGPTTPGVPAARTLSTGTLISHEHGTSGAVEIIQLSDGGRVLRLADLDTSDGPDLHVWLSDAPVLPGRDGWGVFDDGAYVDLGSLKGNKGSQNYEIPAGADLSALRSVTVWCARFHVSFGAAELVAR
ncbi:DM13 domain-containing protein [Nocardia sp. NPDC005978]|uniref:DM13 domain-containing protein n=1 Tax=unclassified Nocardia TaxID=2637762 RepID=UPI0033A4D96F